MPARTLSCSKRAAAPACPSSSILSPWCSTLRALVGVMTTVPATVSPSRKSGSFSACRVAPRFIVTVRRPSAPSSLNEMCTLPWKAPSRPAMAAPSARARAHQRPGSGGEQNGRPAQSGSKGRQRPPPRRPRRRGRSGGTRRALRRPRAQWSPRAGVRERAKFTCARRANTACELTSLLCSLTLMVMDKLRGGRCCVG